MREEVLVEDRTQPPMTIGHPVLAIPGFGGARLEDVYWVARDGGHLLAPYPVAPVVGG